MSTADLSQKFDRQYQCATRLRAHDGQILTSAFTYHKDRPLYVTGANDNTLAVWDVSDCIMSPDAVKRSTDGMYPVLILECAGLMIVNRTNARFAEAFHFIQDSFFRSQIQGRLS